MISPQSPRLARLTSWGLLVVSLALLLVAFEAGERPYCLWLGIGSAMLAGGLGVPLAAVWVVIALGLGRYALFLVPIILGGLAQPWWMTLGITLGFVLWDGLPLLAAVGMASWMIRRNEVAERPWLMLVLPPALLVTGLVWLPRPYHFNPGAPLVDVLPGLIWLTGTDLAAGIALGLLGFAALAIARPMSWKRMAGGLIPLGVCVVGVLGYRIYADRVARMEPTQHRVLAVQGALPPFTGGFVAQSRRALFPMVVFSDLKPDLLLFPENMMQVHPNLDPDTPTASQQRHLTAVGQAIATTNCQVLFGSRDYETSRLYFTDVDDGKLQVGWKDLWGRVPFLDVWPNWAAKLQEKGGFPISKQIQAPAKAPSMGLWAREAPTPDGVKQVGEALVLQGGEIRAPRMVRELLSRGSKVTVAVNAHVGGWLGANESRGASIQAHARLVELGLVGYRVGQLSGTEFVLPWSDAADRMKSIGLGSMSWSAPLPPRRVETGYTTLGWIISFWVAPLVVVGGLVLIVLNLFMVRRARGAKGAEKFGPGGDGVREELPLTGTA